MRSYISLMQVVTAKYTLLRLVRARSSAPSTTRACVLSQVALKEFDEASSVGWRAGQESPGLRTEWRPAEDGSVWVRMEGALSGTDLTHAVAVAHEVRDGRGGDWWGEVTAWERGGYG